MSMSTLIVIGVLFLSWIFIKGVLPKLIKRHACRLALTKVGEKAIAQVPAQIQLTPVEAPQWKNEPAMQGQADPLLQAGFSDLGTHSVDKMPGVLLRILFHSQTCVAAQIYEHPRSVGWTELATRYTDGSSDYLSTLPDQGIAPPPFARTTRVDPGTPTDRLYHNTSRRENQVASNPSPPAK